VLYKEHTFSKNIQGSGFKKMACRLLSHIQYEWTWTVWLCV